MWRESSMRVRQTDRLLFDANPQPLRVVDGHFLVLMCEREPRSKMNSFENIPWTSVAVVVTRRTLSGFNQGAVSPSLHSCDAGARITNTRSDPLRDVAERSKLSGFQFAVTRCYDDRGRGGCTVHTVGGTTTRNS